MHSPLVVAHEIPRPWPQRVDWPNRKWWWPSMVTIWHVEPKGADALTICGGWENGKFKQGWKWHVHHWRIQVQSAQALHRWLFTRCAECKRRFPYGYAPISNQWDGPKAKLFQGEQGLYHHECLGLVSLRRQVSEDGDLIKALFATFAAATEQSEETLLAALTDPKSKGLEFRLAYKLTGLLGYSRDESYNLVKGEK